MSIVLTDPQHKVKVSIFLRDLQIRNFFANFVVENFKMSIIASISSTALRLKQKALKLWAYCSLEVWRDTRPLWWVKAVKVINLSCRSFLNSDLQSRSCSLAYRSILALIPALALLLAIGRGFGLQDVICRELVAKIPSQATALEAAFGYVDGYLAQASGGLFVGVGVAFLLWTVISLIRNIELAFNDIWQINRPRSLWRAIAEYLAIILILPIMLILSSGISLVMSTSLNALLPYGFLRPAVEWIIDFAGIVITWLLFAATYVLVPNTKVRIRNAIIPGILVGTAFQVLQWIFVSGQMYVARYNAIYGSFSFVPLLMIWVQLVWLFTLTGAVICYAMQNIEQFNFGSNIASISTSYSRRTTLGIFTVVARRFHKGLSPLTAQEISEHYKLPINLVTPELLQLERAGLINYVNNGNENRPLAVQPAIDISALTVGDVLHRLDNSGHSDFIPGFNSMFKAVDKIYDNIYRELYQKAANKLIIDIEIKTS